MTRASARSGHNANHASAHSSASAMTAHNAVPTGPGHQRTAATASRQPPNVATSVRKLRAVGCAATASTNPSAAVISNSMDMPAS